MTLHASMASSFFRRHPLAAGLALSLTVPLCGALAAAAVRLPVHRSPTGAATWPVTSCADDGGAGTLRSVVAGAGSGDIVDLSPLTCSTMTLAQGEIAVAQDALTIDGPGAAALTLNGADASRLFAHTGSGTLSITGLGFTAGAGPESDGSGGGCLYSAGSLRLQNVSVSHCRAYDGGGIFTVGDLVLEHVSVTLNTSLSRGGGIFVRSGNLTLKASTIAGNDTGYGGGGVFSEGNNALVESSTISGNHAAEDTAGIGLRPSSDNATDTDSFRLINSTVSGNTSDFVEGGVHVNVPTVEVRNSTVAFNRAGVGCPGFHSNVRGVSVTFESSILSNNATVNGTPCDLVSEGAGINVAGSHNLIVATSTVVPPVLPPDTLNVDPSLLQLANNGGPTWTHALETGSPAVDAGANPLGLVLDQRGAGFARVYGVAADIGAFEVQQPSATPTVTKNFMPSTIPVNGLSTLRIVLGNAGQGPATLIAPLTDALPDSLVVANPAAASTTCAGGTVAAVPGSGSVTLAAGAQIPAAGTCMVTVSVIAHAAGTRTNLIPAGALQTDTGSSADPATANLTVTGQAIAPTVTKAFAPSAIVAGGTSTLKITLGNTRPNAATLTAGLTDNLPAPLVVADPPAATTTCLGGTVTAEAGMGTVTLNAGAQIPGGTCTVTVTVTTAAAGNYFNTIPVGALRTDFGNSPDAANAGLSAMPAIPDSIFANGFDGPAP